MKNNALKLTLHQLETYQIIVPGALDTLWVDVASSLSLTVEQSDDGKPISNPDRSYGSRRLARLTETTLYAGIAIDICQLHPVS